MPVEELAASSPQVRRYTGRSQVASVEKLAASSLQVHLSHCGWWVVDCPHRNHPIAALAERYSILDASSPVGELLGTRWTSCTRPGPSSTSRTPRFPVRIAFCSDHARRSSFNCRALARDRTLVSNENARTDTIKSLDRTMTHSRRVDTWSGLSSARVFLSGS